jgi:hypothetical protein
VFIFGLFKLYYRYECPANGPAGHVVNSFF